jgi:small conductance mechanosensitive channel
MDTSDVEAGVQEVSSAVTEQVDLLTKWLDEISGSALTMGVKVIFAIVIFLIGRVILNFLLKIVDKALERSSVDLTVTKFLNHLIKALGYIVLVLFVLGILGYEATSLAAIIGSAGVAIGLSLQGSLANFAGGLLILILKPYKVGDYIVEGGNEGTVLTIGLAYTELLTVDNKKVVIPNGTISNDRLVNVSAMTERRVDVDLTLSYEADLRVAKKVLFNLIERQENVLIEKGIEVVVCSLEETGVKMQCRCWCTAENYWPIKGALTEKIKLALDDAGVPFYSQTKVNIAK